MMMSICEEHLRIQGMMSGLTISWPIMSMDPQILTAIEQGSADRDDYLRSIEKEMLRHFHAVKQPEDRGPIAQAYEAYAEASVYLLFKNKGINLVRTPGTGQHAAKRPDFLYKHQSGAICFEVKCLDFEGGDTRHKSIAYEALKNAADLDARARTRGVYFSEQVLSSFEPGATPADRIEILIKKLSGNIKQGQLRHGPCILAVHLGRTMMHAHYPSCLLPVYYNDRSPVSCVSGELWHVALGRCGDMIYRLPDFEGAGNLDRPLQEEGILLQCPELLGISFVLPRLSGPAEIYSIWNVTRTGDGDRGLCGLVEHEIYELIDTYSDAVNDDKNAFEYKYIKRSFPASNEKRLP